MERTSIIGGGIGQTPTSIQSPTGGGGLAFRQLPATAANTDAFDLLKNTTDIQLANLNQQYDAAEAEATASANNRITTLKQEYGIERRGLEQQWNQLLGMNLDSNTLQKHSSRLRLELLGLNQKYELAGTRISGKTRPDVESLRAARQENINKIHSTNMLRQIELNVYRQLERSGDLTPSASRAAQFRCLGIEISESQLRGQQPASSEEMLIDINRQIAATEDEIKNFSVQTPGGFKKLLGAKSSLIYSPTGLRGEARTAETEEAERYRDLVIGLDTLHKQRVDLIRQTGGRFAGSLETATRLQRIVAGQNASQFGRSIRSQMPKTQQEEPSISKATSAGKPLTTTIVKMYLKRYGNMETARQAAIRDGFVE